jgi:DNA-binding GntR family transcriptional regulator
VPAQEEAPNNMRESLTAAGARRVARPAPLRQAVYDALADMIANGSLKPGQHLVESDLAEHLGVSRQPIREALQRLQADGWVELRPAYGAFVHTPAVEEVVQLLGVRSVLEAYSAHGAALHATKENIARLWELQDAGVAALAEDDERALVEANSALHKYIVEISGNKVLAELISQVERRVRWYYTPIARPRGKQAWNEHASLIRAIAEGDADQAHQLMRRHTERTTEFYREEIAAAPDTLAV